MAVKLNKVISQHFQSTVSGFTKRVYDKKVTLVNLYGLLIFQKNDENNFLWWFLKFFVKTKERVVFHCLLKMIKLKIFCLLKFIYKRKNESQKVNYSAIRVTRKKLWISVPLKLVENFFQKSERVAGDENETVPFLSILIFKNHWNKALWTNIQNGP